MAGPCTQKLCTEVALFDDRSIWNLDDPDAPISISDFSSDDTDLLDFNSDTVWMRPIESDDEFQPEPPSTYQMQQGCSPCPDSPLPQLKRKAATIWNAAAKRGRCGSSTSTETGDEEEDEEEKEWWHDRWEKDKKPDPLPFKPSRIPGPQCDKTKSWSPLALFQLFFSPSVVQTIINNTNANAAKRQQAGKKYSWEKLTVQEFYIFLAVIIFTGLVTVHNTSDYWKKTPPYNFSFPRNKMSRGRFEAILWSLHLSDPAEDEENEKKKNTKEYDRLFKIKPLYSELVDACKSHFHPHQNITIDERMVASNARTSTKDKATNWGYKLFVLADSSTAYTWNFFVYTGQSESTEGQSLSDTAVIDLLPLAVLGTGYTVYADNFYISPALVQDLAEKFTGCCGTIKRSALGFPQTQVNDLPKKAEKGDLRWIRRKDLLFVKWMDRRQVAMCSSVHEAFTGQTVSRRVKEAGVWQAKSVPVPDVVVDYDSNMRDVDLSDALIGFYSVSHKIMKWYKTFFCYFVDIAVANSFLLHKELLKLQNDVPAKSRTPKAFREQLLNEMLEIADSAAPRPVSTLINCMPVFYASDNCGRIRKHCRNCLEDGIPRVETPVYCQKCEVSLCLTSKKNCFQLWHDNQ